MPAGWLVQCAVQCSGSAMVSLTWDVVALPCSAAVLGLVFTRETLTVLDYTGLLVGQSCCLCSSFPLLYSLSSQWGVRACVRASPCMSLPLLGLLRCMVRTSPSPLLFMDKWKECLCCGVHAAFE